MSSVITGRAYGERATLEICGEALTWRARPTSELRENVATTIHDVHDAHWIEQRLSLFGIVLVAAGLAIWFAGVLAGALAIATGLGLLAWRRSRPRRMLILDLADRRLVIDVDAPSAPLARALVARIDRVIQSGELPSSPASLP